MPLKSRIIKSMCFLLFFSLGLLNNLKAQSHSDTLSAELQKHFEESNLPGFAVSVVNEDKVLYQHGFGYADKENKIPFSISTVENLGSVSKTFVGLALILAIKEGLLSFDAEINDYLLFKVVNPYFPDEPILIRHLVTHTSTITDTKHYQKSYIYEEDKRDQSLIDQDYLSFIIGHEKLNQNDFLFNILDRKGEWYKKKNYLKTRPGTQKEYSNLNAALMVVILENVTGISFKDYTNERIFDPLKMSSTAWSVQSVNPELVATTYFANGKIVPKYSLITYPDGGLYSCVSNLTIYLKEIIKAYLGESEYLTPQFAKMLLPGDNDENRAFWGMGQESRNIGHGGSDPGVQTDLQFNADNKIGRIIITNINAGENENLWKQYREIHSILKKYELKLAN